MTRAAKDAAKIAAYEEAMRIKRRAALPDWVCHSWDHENECLCTSRVKGYMSRPDANHFREGSIDEIEQRENAGQKDLFQ
jgi:hypothetical protein